MIRASRKAGCTAPSPPELFQLKNGIEPCVRTFSNGVVGKLLKTQVLPSQSAKGEAKEISEGGFWVSSSNADTAPMSHGACSPVNWVPIWPPQSIGFGGGRLGAAAAGAAAGR